ncbi:hypothetical protein CDD80_6423 [Ophiocordyceps camponoti-rufipedis]|uniref:Uncharacterized protein n=1 Tax=Ophiocordyceps camponoti-rufipedis TaxID=2004952 RepID=A0A2C5ZN95_9HYPO|nr:hypothetical protein CDD80_6423 [Ophiocordyceps camponoti-rufipedis]
MTLPSAPALPLSCSGWLSCSRRRSPFRHPPRHVVCDISSSPSRGRIRGRPVHIPAPTSAVVLAHPHWPPVPASLRRLGSKSTRNGLVANQLRTRP